MLWGSKRCALIDQAGYSLWGARGQRLLPAEMTSAFYRSPSQHSQSPSAVSRPALRGRGSHSGSRQGRRHSWDNKPALAAT